MTQRRQRNPRRGRRIGLVEGALFGCFALAVRAATASGTTPPEIHIENFRFDPPTLEVSAGATVTWLNQDEEVHTVTSTDHLFTSPGLEGAQPFSYRFEKPGTYEYRCALHPQMKGVVVVH